MTDYYKLYEYCKKTFEKKDHIRKQYLANKKSRLKKELFTTIIQDATNIIKENADEGYNYAIIYDNEYNELIYDLLDSLSHHFKPFNVIYKKKTHTQRGFLEVLTDETNYVIMIDWKKQINEKLETEEKHSDNGSIIYNNISELPSKNILNEEQEMENKILDKSIVKQEIDNKKTVSNKKNDNDDNDDNDDDDNIINKFGFETIF